MILTVLAALLGVVGALSGALGLVLATLWVMNQSGTTSELPGLAAALGCAGVAVVAILGRRTVVAAAASWPAVTSS